MDGANEASQENSSFRLEKKYLKIYIMSILAKEYQ
jgi:hypothetical protein